jgi:phospholipid N-methyltransferase
MTKEEVLQNCTVQGNIIKLPTGQLERKLYLEVAKSLELIGGKWKGGKVFGFVFPSDPTKLLEQIASGEKRNLKKEFQFFATPAPLAEKLIAMAEIESHHTILEPSAGQGALVKAINNLIPNKRVYCYELMPVNQTFLNEIDTVEFIGEDFLNTDNTNAFDVIIANPPFSKNQDIDHIKEMYNRLKPGGRIVTISSKHWRYSNNRKETEFKEWLSEVNASVEEIEPGAFKKSGTEVGGLIITINKN